MYDFYSFEFVELCSVAQNMVVLGKNVPCELERNMYSAAVNFNFCYFSVVKFPFDSVFIIYSFFAENFYNTFPFVLRIFVLTLWSFVIAFLVFLHHSTHRSFHNISHPVARELAFLGTFSICAMDSFSFLGCSSNLLEFVGGVGRKTPTRFSQPDYPSRFEILNPAFIYLSGIAYFCFICFNSIQL